MVMTLLYIFISPTPRSNQLSNRLGVDIGCISENVGEESPPNLGLKCRDIYLSIDICIYASTVTVVYIRVPGDQQRKCDISRTVKYFYLKFSGALLCQRGTLLVPCQGPNPYK